MYLEIQFSHLHLKSIAVIKSKIPVILNGVLKLFLNVIDFSKINVAVEMNVAVGLNVAFDTVKTNIDLLVQYFILFKNMSEICIPIG